MAKTPRELARTMKDRSESEAVLETISATRTEVTARTQRIFEKYPSSTYLTEVISSRRLLGSGSR